MRGADWRSTRSPKLSREGTGTRWCSMSMIQDVIVAIVIQSRLRRLDAREIGIAVVENSAVGQGVGGIVRRSQGRESNGLHFGV